MTELLEKAIEKTRLCFPTAEQDAIALMVLGCILNREAKASR